MNLETPEVLHLPAEIKNDISEKGFHLYKWISPDEVKISVEKDFLKVMKYIGGILGGISILVSLPFYSDIAKMLQVFFGAISIGIFFIFLYLLFVSLKRSFLLSRGAFAILTDSSISLGGKIVKLSEISELKKEMKHVETTFEEELFGKSRLLESKKKLSESVLGQVFGGYKLLFSDKKDSKISFGQGKDSEKAILLILALYTLYVGVMSIVYFIGVFFLWIFGKIITWANTKYLIYRGNTVIKINSLFQHIDILSEDLYMEKKSLKTFLTQAYENEWKDGLLLSINDELEKITQTANTITSKATSLRDTIYSSRYKDMFQSNTYNNWVKRQVVSPLKDIKKLLEKNLEIIETSLGEIHEQLQTTEKSEFQSTLSLQIRRLEMQRNDMEKFLPRLEEMILKLK